jgi:hypothetical protein
VRVTHEADPAESRGSAEGGSRMEPAVVVALIGVAGSIAVAVLNHHLQGRVRAQGSRIDQLYALSMSDDLYRQLQKLNTGRYGPYWVDEEMRYGLGPELNYLKMLGYIKFTRFPDIREMPKGDCKELNLSDYVEVTSQGKAFLRLREGAESRS